MIIIIRDREHDDYFYVLQSCVGYQGPSTSLMNNDIIYLGISNLTILTFKRLQNPKTPI